MAYGCIPHLCETKDEERFTLEKFGMRPLAYMESVDFTGSDVFYAHGIYFNDEELQFLADTGTGVAHCPCSNSKLSSGVARVPEMLRLGVPVGLAVDGSASNDASNLMEEIRTAYLMHRLRWGKDAPSGYECSSLPRAAARACWAAQNWGRSRPGRRRTRSPSATTARSSPARSGTRRIYSARWATTARRITFG
jgi:cytosine/adenosine deaminase-related metal-dependent hydrolase